MMIHHELQGGGDMRIHDGITLSLREIIACARYVAKHIEDPQCINTIDITPCMKNHGGKCVNIYWTERKQPFLHVDLELADD